MGRRRHYSAPAIALAVTLPNSIALEALLVIAGENQGAPFSMLPVGCPFYTHPTAHAPARALFAHSYSGYWVLIWGFVRGEVLRDVPGAPIPH